MNYSCCLVNPLLNMSEKDYARQKNKHYQRIIDHIKSLNKEAAIIPYCAALESKLLKMNIDEKAECCKALSETCKPHLDKIIKTGYEQLNLIHYFTCGADEVRCWTIRKFTKAPDAAGVIHTDFHDFFICAEVFKYKDLKKLGSETEVRSEGKILTQGKEYMVDDGDILFIKHNAKGNAGKKK